MPPASSWLPECVAASPLLATAACCDALSATALEPLRCVVSHLSGTHQHLRGSHGATRPDARPRCQLHKHVRVTLHAFGMHAVVACKASRCSKLRLPLSFLAKAFPGTCATYLPVVRLIKGPAFCITPCYPCLVNMLPRRFCDCPPWSEASDCLHSTHRSCQSRCSVCEGCSHTVCNPCSCSRKT